MKRCPECLFIYPETDARCDFDNAELVVVDDAEIDSATTTVAAPAATSTKKKRAAVSSSKKRPAGSKKGGRKKGTAILAAVGLVFGLGSFFAYFGLRQRAAETVAEIPPVASLAPVVAPLVVVAPSPAVETPSPSPTPLVQIPSDRTATSHTRTTVAPVSTSGPGMGKGAKPVILLTTGGKIDADEVWRTRDGVWYRRSGIVTLLKHNRVKAIINQ